MNTIKRVLLSGVITIAAGLAVFAQQPVDPATLPSLKDLKSTDVFSPFKGFSINLPATPTESITDPDEMNVFGPSTTYLFRFKEAVISVRVTKKKSEVGSDGRYKYDKRDHLESLLQSAAKGFAQVGKEIKRTKKNREGYAGLEVLIEVPPSGKAINRSFMSINHDFMFMATWKGPEDQETPVRAVLDSIKLPNAPSLVMSPAQ